MSDHPDKLKADLLAVLSSGPSEVTADEAISRASSVGTSRLVARPYGRRISSRQGRRLTAISFAVVIGLLAGYLVAGGHVGGGAARRTQTGGRGPAVGVTPSFVREVMSIPATVYSKVGLPTEIVNFPKKVSGDELLTSDGRPELLYMWASYCPFCAAENWALAMALSRFGTFRDLGTTNSSVSDFAPDSSTLSFYGATYSSRFVALTSYDLATNEPASAGAKCNVNGYTCLETPSASATNLFQTLGAGSMPFLDFGNKVIQTGAGYADQPLVLAGLTVSQIASQLSDTNSQVARAEVGSANYITAAICALTGNESRVVCSTPVIARAEAKEGDGTGNLQRAVTTPTSTTTTVPTSATQPQGARGILAPASVPPVSNECTIPLTHDADGNVTPLVCPGGGVNKPAWQQYARGHTCTSTACGSTTWSKVMQLGPGATATEVFQAMCLDYKHIFGTNPLTVSAEQLANTYYGWQFVANNPVSTFEQKGCSG